MLMLAFLPAANLHGLVADGPAANLHGLVAGSGEGRRAGLALWCRGAGVGPSLVVAQPRRGREVLGRREVLFNQQNVPNSEIVHL